MSSSIGAIAISHGRTGLVRDAKHPREKCGNHDLRREAISRLFEEGIRNAAGAIAADIVRLLVWHSAKPVLCANLIACPSPGS